MNHPSIEDDEVDTGRGPFALRTCKRGTPRARNHSGCSSCLQNLGRDWNLAEIACKMRFITNLYASRTRTCSVLKGANLAEEGVLGTGDNDFLPVGKQEEKVGGVKQTGLFDVRKVYNAVTRDAKERRGIEPSLAIPQYAPDEHCAVQKMNTCLIAAGLKEPDVGRPNQPALPVISQKNKIIGAESAILFLHGRLGTTFEHRRVEDLILSRGVLSTFYFATMRRDAPAGGAAAGIVQSHKGFVDERFCLT
jgi:hypothetical protein